MEKLDEKILEIKEELKNWPYYSSLFFKKIDDKNFLFISEVKDLPINGFGVNSTLPSEKLCAFLDNYIPYYYSEVLDSDIHIHNYVFNYPKLSSTLINYNCNTLNNFAMLPLEKIKETPDVEYSLEFSRDISLNIAMLLMKKDTFTIEELYNNFISVFPKLSNYSLDDFKNVYKEYNGVIVRNYKSIVYNLIRIPYINEKYSSVIIDYLRFNSEENINYLRSIIIRYLKDEYFKEKLAKCVNAIDLDRCISTILCQDTLKRKLQNK